MEERLGEKVELEPGGPGQFDVLVGDEVVATRSKGWVRLLGGGWPEVDDVVRAIEERQAT